MSRPTSSQSDKRTIGCGVRGWVRAIGRSSHGDAIAATNNDSVSKVSHCSGKNGAPSDTNERYATYAINGAIGPSAAKNIATLASSPTTQVRLIARSEPPIHQ